MKGIKGIIIGIAALLMLVGSNAWSSADLRNAAWNNDISRAKARISEGDDVNSRDSYGTTALIWTAVRGHVEMAKILIAAGADVNMQDKFGSTPILIAAQSGYNDLIKLFIKAGADPNIKLSSNGYTALSLAVKARHTETVRILLEANADPYAITDYRYTVLGYAKSRRLEDIQNLIEGAMKDQSDTFLNITSIQKLSENLLQIHWRLTNDNIKHIELEYSTNLSGPWTTYNIDKSVRTFYLYNLSPNLTYYFRIRIKGKYSSGKYFITTKNL